MPWGRRCSRFRLMSRSGKSPALGFRFSRTCGAVLASVIGGAAAQFAFSDSGSFAYIPRGETSGECESRSRSSIAMAAGPT